MSLEQRKVKTYDFPLVEGLEILKPEQVIIRLSNGKTIDIGSLCYLVRQETQKAGLRRWRNMNGGLLVKIDSLSNQRVKDVRHLLKHISSLLAFGGIRLETIRDRVTRFIPFMYWIDSHGYYDVLHNIDVARESLYQYIYYLKERSLRNEISINSAARQQDSVIRLLSDVLEYEELKNNLPLIRVCRAIKKTTEPPCENEQGKVLSLCNSLFDGLTTLVLDYKLYPFPLAMPNYLGFDNNLLWVFPAELWFMHPKKANQKRKMCLGYNYQSGVLNTLEQINSLRVSPATFLQSNLIILKAAQKNILTANKNNRDSQRIHVATIALNVFIILFMAQTGMSWSQLLNLQWTDDFDISREKQSFRTIKWRANGKMCYFELSVEFMPKFKRFISLRNYLLNNRVFEYLFFTLGERGLGDPKIKTGEITGIYEILKRVNPDIKIIGARAWRAAKSDWLIRNTDISTTALVLQNTEKTVISSYIAGTKSQQLEEVSQYLNNLSDVVINRKLGGESTLQGVIGQCISYGQPSKLDEISRLEPNCLEPEGCLFCDKYRIHTDLIDIRKLLSFQFYIEKTSWLVGGNVNQYKVIHNIMQRLNDIIDELSTHNKDIISQVKSEIEDGELDIYWSKKIELLMELGWVV